MGYDSTKPENIKTLELIQTTHPKEGPITLERVGRRFSIKKDPKYWKDYEEFTATDSIGTKAYVHWIMGTFPYAVQDAVAMPWNDLMEVGAPPYAIQDQILIQEEDQETIYSIMKGLRDICFKYQWKVDEQRSNPVIISSGDTSINNLIKGFDIGVNATGKVKIGEKVIPNLKEGDLVIGIKSSGLHSNGFTDVRETLFDKLKLKLDYKLGDGTTLGNEITKPTIIYLPDMADLLENSREYVDGLVNMTGGAYTKLKELTNNKFDIVIEREHELSPQPIFNFIYEKGKWSDEKMYRLLNNGIGYIAFIDKDGAQSAFTTLCKHHETDIIGYVKEGTGKIEIESQFSNRKIVF
jgi:phosphoribosylformylglycinamidine cyclo-ligase